MGTFTIMRTALPEEAAPKAPEITRQGFEYYYDGLEGDTGYWLYVSNRCEWDWLDKELGKTFYINETLLKHWPANVWGAGPAGWPAQYLHKGEAGPLRH